MISFKKMIIKSWIIAVSLTCCNILAAAELVEESITTPDDIVEPTFGEENDGLICKIPPSVQNFDLEAFVDGTWYAHEASKTIFISETDRCITAQYTILDTPTSQGWTIGVLNRSENKMGKDNPDGELCGIQSEKLAGTGTLQVGTCFLPPTAVPNNYFVLAYEQVPSPSYALIASGSQPLLSDPNCGCSAPSGGLYIFTRSQQRDETTISTVQGIAQDLGYGLCDLFTVSQEDC